MKTSKLVTLLISIILFGSLLNAKGMNPTPFGDYDNDKNGYITQKEFDDTKTIRMEKNADDGKMLRNASNSLQFSKIDANNDGKVTKSELTTGQQFQMLEQRKNRMNNKKGSKGKNYN